MCFYNFLFLNILGKKYLCIIMHIRIQVKLFSIYMATEKEIISRKTETFYSKTKAKTHKQIKVDNICRKVYKI